MWGWGKSYGDTGTSEYGEVFGIDVGEIIDFCRDKTEQLPQIIKLPIPEVVEPNKLLARCGPEARGMDEAHRRDVP